MALARADDGEQSQTSGLRLERVTFAFGTRVIVRDVSLRIAPGEQVGLLGPNGAGKSTLLRLASGVLRPVAGRIYLGDDALNELARTEIARRVAVVPQEYAVQFAYTVRQLVALGRTPHTGAWGLLGKHDEAAIETAIALTDLAPFADRVFNDLSGGERQRVLVAMALAQNSPLLLLDEPTAHLDIRHQIEVLELLSRLNQDHRLTVVAALHDLNLAARYFPRLVLFRQEVAADGAPATVLDQRLLAQVYETSVRVGILRGDAVLSVVPPNAIDAASQTRPEHDQSGRVRVHVVAGGGSGEVLMRSLADAGIAFTAGALNQSDSDYTLASQLAVTCIGELPYAPISSEALAATSACMAAAEVTVVCPSAFGPGNSALLDCARRAAQDGSRVILLEPESAGLAGAALESMLGAGWQQRDFTGGRALASYTALLEAGALVVATPGELVAQVLAGPENAHEDG